MAQAKGTVADDLDYIPMVKLIAQASAQGAWLIFVGHEIGERARQTTAAIALVALCKYMQDPANRVWVDTVEKIGKYIQQRRTGQGEWDRQ